MIYKKNLHDEQLVLILDGTYCYCQKSSNNLFQRKSYSVQKKTHLLKPFVICATDGHIFDIYGLFEAKLRLITKIKSHHKIKTKNRFIQ
jgi:hypothetical protein